MGFAGTGALFLPTSLTMSNRKPIVLIVFGEGGHSTAMHRLMAKLSIPSGDCIQLYEQGAKPLPDILGNRVPRIMPKRRGAWRYLAIPNRILINLICVIQIFIRYDVRSIMTTGPGIAVFPALFARVTGRPVVFLESWCRFEKISNTGHILAYLNATLYVQNYELMPKLPGVRFSGRL